MSNGNRGNGLEQIFGYDDSYSPRAIQAYLARLRRADRMIAHEIHDTAEELKTVIERSPGIGVLLGYDSRRKARLVCEPLFEAANAHNAAANLAVLSWQRFHKHFGEAIEQARRAKQRPGQRTVNWDDV